MRVGENRDKYINSRWTSVLVSIILVTSGLVVFWFVSLVTAGTARITMAAADCCCVPSGLQAKL